MKLNAALVTTLALAAVLFVHTFVHPSSGSTAMRKLADATGWGTAAAEASSPHPDPDPDANPSGSSQPGASGEQSPAAPADFGPMRTVEVIDSLFNMVVFTMQIPANWRFEGTVLYGPGCFGGLDAHPVYRAYSPDMRYGLQDTPDIDFYWAEDPRALPKGPCKILPPISAANFGNIVSISSRPGSEIDYVESTPDEPQFQAAIQRRNPNGNGEVKRLHLLYDLNGQAEEEILRVEMTRWTTQVRANVSRGPMVNYQPRLQFGSRAHVLTARAPQGQLQSHFDALMAIRNSYRGNPEWTNRFIAYSQSLLHQQIAASWAVHNSMMRMSQEIFERNLAESQQFVQNMNTQGDIRHANVMAGIDRQGRHTQDVCDAILNQQLFVNPSTGQTFKASNQFNYTYYDGAGSVVQSMAPAQYLGDWTQALPIHH